MHIHNRSHNKKGKKLDTPLLLVISIPLLFIVAVVEYYAMVKWETTLGMLAQIIAFAAEVPLLVWIHRSVKDERVALWVAYFLILAFLWGEYALVRFITFRILKRVGRLRVSRRRTA